MSSGRGENEAVQPASTARTRLDPTSADPAPPCALVIFGAGGDLTQRLLMPAVYNLAVARLLDERFAVLGINHRERSEEEFRVGLTDAIRGFVDAKGDDPSTNRLDAAACDWLGRRSYYLAGDFDDPATYQRLADRLRDLERSHHTGGNAVFYLATAPHFFGAIVERLAAAGLTREPEGTHRRVVIEKPFGRDLASAVALNRRILAVLDERQVYRMDHFLGKETVQNIMALRFGNGIFEPLWNRSHIDHVQITAAETVGVEGRGSFYEPTGALRDMVPNHMFQLLAMTAMEAPNSFDADAVRTEKAKVIEAIRDLAPEQALRDSVRGQYAAGNVAGHPIRGYRDEPKVAPDSRTETYVALKLMIDNWRWAQVPFYLRTGKAMPARRTEIVIQFKQVPCALFRDGPGPAALAPNLLVLHVQPDEGISLRFEAKVPGPVVRLSGVDMDFRYADYFNAAPSTGYETLLYDCLIGDPTLFQRADNIEAGWRAVQPFLDGWQAVPDGVRGYTAGSWGPEQADTLLEGDGRWRNDP
jgi:glucose-6-phosphate 1-dehydrogenase